jgi:hypothetical protein
MADIDRKANLLTKKKRRQLLNQEWNTENHRTTAMGQIVDRIHNTLYDFSILFDGIDQTYRDKIFNDLNAGESAELYDGMIDAIALFYEISITRENFDFEEMLQEAVEQVHQTKRGDRSTSYKKVDIDFEIETTQYLEQRTVEKAIAKFERGAELSDREIAMLVKWGGIEVDQMLGIIRERHQERVKEESREKKFGRIASRPDFGHFESDSDE